MAQTIKLKRSAVSGNTPSTSDLELGEIAINTYDGKVFIKKNDGSASVVEVGAADNTKLPLTGGTMTGAINMGGNNLTNLATLSTVSGNLTLDSAADIILDAGGQNWFFDDDGTRVLSISQVSSDVYIGTEQNDKDLIFRGKDGSSTISALTLDMSNAGAATFNSNIKLFDNNFINLGTSNDLQLYHSSSQNRGIIQNSTGALHIDQNQTDGNIVITSDDGSGGSADYIVVDGGAGAVHLKHYGNTKLSTTSTGVAVTGNLTTSANLTVSGNLEVTGTTTQTGSIITNSNFTGLSDANSSNATDFGFYGKYVESSTTKYAGIYYDASVDNTFKFFCDTQTAPTTTVNESATGYALANVQVAGLTVGGTIANTSGDLTLDVAGDITLDADGGDVRLKDNGTEFLNFYAGTIERTGSLIFDVSGNITLNADGSTISLNDDTINFGQFYQNASGALNIYAPTQDKDILFLGNDGGSTVTALTLDMSAAGEAIFNSDIRLFDSKAVRFGTDQDFRISNDGSHTTLQNSTSNQDILFKGNDDGTPITALTLDMSNAGKATFSGIVSSAQGFERGNMFITQNEIDVSSGNLTLDVAGDIKLDSDSGSWRFQDNGGSIIELSVGSESSPTFYSVVSNADIVFRGNDGGSAITALTLDMSQAGEADFNSAVKVAGGIVAHQTNRGVLEYASNVFKVRSYGATSGSGSITLSTGGGGNSADTVALTLDNNQNATFAGTISANTADLRNTSSGAETTALSLRNYAAGANTATALNFYPTQSTTRFASIVAENVDGNNNIALSFLTSAGDTPTAALTLNQDRSATFSAAVTAGGLKIDGGTLSHASSNASSITISGGSNSTNGMNMSLGGSSGSLSQSVVWKQNSSEKMRLDSSGQLGIGTASPTSLLHLSSGSYPKATFSDTTGVARNFSVGTNNETFTIRNETASADAFTIDNANNAHFHSLLDLPSKIRHTGDSDTYIEFNANDSWRVVTGDEERIKANNGEVIINDNSADMDFRVESNNNAGMLFVDGTNDKVGIGTSAPASLLNLSHATAPELRFSRTGTGQQWVQSIDSSGRLLFLEAASTGGTLYTRFKIDDTGEITFNEAYTFPTADGSAGQVLKTDGSGNLTFQNDSGGGSASTSISDADGDTKIQVEESSDEDKIRFDTAGSERMIIDASGNVGIGASAPRATLDVRGGHSSTVNEAISFGRTDDNYRYNSIYSFNTSLQNSYLSFKIHDGGSSVAQTETMVLKPGKVGIGTTTPGSFVESSRLVVGSGTSGTNEMMFLYSGTNTFGALGFADGTSGTEAYRGIMGYDHNTDTMFFSTAGGGNASRDVIIGSNGGVSIGTSTSTGTGGLLVSNDIKTNSRFGVGSGGNLTDAALYKNDDTNTGIYWPAADTLGFTTAGAERARIDANGKVLVNSTVVTSTGNTKFQVGSESTALWTAINSGTNSYQAMASEISIANTVNNTTNSFAGIFFQAGETTDGGQINSARIGAVRTAAFATDLVFASRNSSAAMTEHLRINSSGNVGIGTTAPTTKLEVSSGGADVTTIKASYNSTNYLEFAHNRINAVSSGGNDSILLQTAGTTRAIINQSGNVGIGTTAPSQKLQVVGNIAAKATGSDAGILIEKSDNTNTLGGIIQTGSGDGALVLRNTSNSQTLLLRGQGNNYITGGSFAIGHTSPARTLHVNSSGTNVTARFESTDSIAAIELKDPNGSAEIGNVGNDLALFPAGIEKARLVAGGGLAIGTTSTTNKLDVLAADGEAANTYVARFRNQEATDGQSFGININAGSNASDLALNIADHDNSNTLFRVRGDGNVGIGTSSPAHTLDILKTGSGDAAINIKSTTGGDPTIIFNSAAANRNGLLKFQDNGTNVGRIQYVHNGDRIDFQAGSATSATMSVANGKVGIGTTAPQVKLQINDTGTAASSSGYGTGFNVARSDGLIGMTMGFTSANNSMYIQGRNFTNTDKQIIALNPLGGNVGIGTTTPGEKLEVAGNVESEGLKLNVNTSMYTQNASLSYYSSTNAVYLNGPGNNGWLRLNASGTQNDGVAINLFGSAAGNLITLKTNTAERMRIDASGNLLVGTTNTTWQSQEGLRYFTGNSLVVTRDSDEPMSLNRLTNDGDILLLRKDGTTIGGVAVQDSDNLYISSRATNHAGLKFGTQTLIPMVQTAQSDNTVSLGTSSVRFHDAHFGGTVNVGENLVVTGNLTINGTTTTLNTATLDVEDKNITLNYGSGDTSSTADGAGITIQDAVNSTTDASFTWRASDDKFISSHPIRAFGGFELPDSNKLIAGDSSDLQFYHDGSNSYIQHGNTGNFNITTAAGTEFALVAQNNGSVFLYHDGTAKFQTTSGGASVTGALSVSGNLSTGFFEIGDDSTTTTATTQVAIAAFAASSVRSCKLIVQVTNTTDSTYHFTEVSIIHDGTDTYMTEVGSMFTGTAAEATFTSDISSGSVRLLATPASTDSMTFKVVRQMITV